MGRTYIFTKLFGSSATVTVVLVGHADMLLRLVWSCAGVKTTYPLSQPWPRLVLDPALLQLWCGLDTWSPHLLSLGSTNTCIIVGPLILN